MEKQLRDLCKCKSVEWIDGFSQGVWLFAHWKEGVQYVGTTGNTFKEVIDILRKIAKEVDDGHIV